MQFIFNFYLAHVILSIVGYPAISKIFSNFGKTSYFFTKTIPLLLLSYLVWISGVVASIPKGALTIWAIVLIFGLWQLPAIKSFYKSKENKASVLNFELLYGITFLAMLALRGAMPAIIDIEKFMDFAILNGLERTRTLPPQDVWFAGETINYYYFGHFIFSVLLKLTRIPAEVGYNIAVSYIFATGFCLSYTIGKTLLNTSATQPKISSAKTPMRVKFLGKGLNFSLLADIKEMYRSFGLVSIINVLPLLGAAVLVAGGNLDFLYQHLVGTSNNYFYAQARSIIPYTINEFPLYSFLIGDLHAHIMNIPFVLTAIGLFIEVYFRPKQSVPLYFLVSIALGALGVINSWDLVIYTPLFTLLLLLKTRRMLDSVLTGCAVFFLAVMAFLPFYIHFQPPTQGIGFFFPKNEIVEILRMFGYFFWVVLSFLVTLVFSKNRSPHQKVLLLLISYGLFLVMLPEFFFLKDIYYKVNPPYFRANTVFKVWYQAWIVLGLCAPAATYYGILQCKSTYMKKIGIYVFVFLTFFVFLYTTNSVKALLGPTYIFKGINGTAYLQQEYPEIKDVIDWINSNINEQPVVLEAAGRPYTRDSIVSSYTGVPTVVGWTEHQLGWRGDWGIVATRMGDVQTLYGSKNVQEVKRLIEKYNIEYVVVGKTEQEKYGADAGNTLSTIGKLILSSGNVKFLRVID